MSAGSSAAVRQAVADPGQLGQALGVGDQGLGAAVGQAVLQRLGPEQGEERHGDGAQLVGGEVGKRRLRRLGQQDADPLAARETPGGQRVGELVGKALEPGEGVALDVAVGALVDQRQAPGLAGPLVAGVEADVVARRHPPAEAADERLVAFGLGQHGVPRPPRKPTKGKSTTETQRHRGEGHLNHEGTKKAPRSVSRARSWQPTP
jgi:hypothetical protein